MNPTPNNQPAVVTSSHELGLDLAAIAARYLFETDHLHYGLWTEDLPVHMKNLHKAQEQYSDLIVSTIPDGTKTILDVGTGTGALARRLMDAGYSVDCVSPSPYLTERARANVGTDAQIFECKFEDLVTDKRYDLILFSESFQYIPLNRSLVLSQEYLNTGGHVLICDYFRNDTPDKGPFGGGHHLKDFRKELESSALTPLLDRDITPLTAPNLDLVADMNDKVVAPMKAQLFAFARVKYPFWFKLTTSIFKKPLAHFDTKYMGGKRSGKNFQVYKSYRLLLFAKGTQGKLAGPEMVAD
ncbi:MAG: methyltransferase domain-containing protein [Akkermansiaceae bacterium]|nr:methyltransferase domain-containing protein [Armatimonadota bacterium]